MISITEITISKNPHSLSNSIKKKQKFSFRVFTSIAVILSGFITIFTGVILLGFGLGLNTLNISLKLYSESFLGISKNMWVDVHDYVGLGFSILGSFHFHWNWSRFSNYFTHPRRRILYRKIVSTFLLINFVLSAFSGILWFLRHLSGDGEKHGGGSGKNIILPVHTISSILFGIVIILHIILNWKSILAYFRRKKVKSLSKEGEKIIRILRFWREILTGITLVAVILILSVLLSIFL
ncbi:MAG: hypothetical protein DRO88_13200 [Promethearchaeia archaeon]|nr:MAG: hypothetical protein DRO88_13200 [Candidatus Lokiarchaeia archaeon]